VIDFEAAEESRRTPVISVVSPVYRAEKTVAVLVERLSKALESIGQDYEIILVDDGSFDNSWGEISAAAQKNSRVKGFRLSRNFGQHYAITAGLSQASGDWVVVMDCDLQDLPEEIPRLYEAAVAGNYDLVLARRAKRRDPLVRRLISRIFYMIFSYLTETEQDASVANFGIYKKKVIGAILSMGDSVRFFPTMSQWVGFSRGYLVVEHSAREDGGSTYTYQKLIALALSNVVAFSSKPLRLTVGLGVLVTFVSSSVGVFYLYRYFSGEIVVLGYMSLILSIWFLGGVIIALIGVVGIYVGQTFDRVKSRPYYVISESTQEALASHLGKRCLEGGIAGRTVAW
jgi:dolichol-phosphate mannosyltransferase